MQQISVTSSYLTLPADTVTPVCVYLRVRDLFSESFLLESSDYHSLSESRSYIGINPIASIHLHNNTLVKEFPNGTTEKTFLTYKHNVLKEIQGFINAFQAEESEFKFISNGLFGYMGYDAIEYLEDIDFSKKPQDDISIPDFKYSVFETVLVFNHFNDEIVICHHQFDKKKPRLSIDDLKSIIFNRNYSEYQFRLSDEEESFTEDKAFLDMIRKGKSHCLRGDVFQVVLSRRYARRFQGDEFNVYRKLRQINPSPYLFYFDYGKFKIFGSSPEAQLVVSNGLAEIHPIAGTFKRTGDTETDEKIARKLFNDPKENSEHVMLVDLARNDLSRCCKKVEVERFKSIQTYSHVIHLTSKVTGRLNHEKSPLDLLASTFPAGTLSGAPKIRAIQIIDKQEKLNRSYYGGAIGIISFDGCINKAIMIRTFLSFMGKLYFQAGAGIVSYSDPDNEKKEVDNKLGALRQAMISATS